MIKYVIKTDRGYVTDHRRGRLTKNLASAKTFTTVHGAKSNRWFRLLSGNPRVIDVDFFIALADGDDYDD